MHSIFISLLLVPVFGFALNLPDASRLTPRTTPSDPCCKSCSGINHVLNECATSPDIFCGCAEWVATAPACEACIYDVGFNTSFAVNPGPALELFWAWCPCQGPCRTTAEAIFGSTCNAGTDNVCKSKVLVKDGPSCLKCMKGHDMWFSSFFAVWIAEAQLLLSGHPHTYPGTFPSTPKSDDRTMLVCWIVFVSLTHKIQD